jgi:hypothetical protein
MSVLASHCSERNSRRNAAYDGDAPMRNAASKQIAEAQEGRSAATRMPTLCRDRTTDCSSFPRALVCREETNHPPRAKAQNLASICTAVTPTEDPSIYK